MPEPDYKNDLVFEPSTAPMPRCDIEDLQNKLNITIDTLKEIQDDLYYLKGCTEVPTEDLENLELLIGKVLKNIGVIR